MYKVFNKINNEFTGVEYKELNDSIIEHHSKQYEGLLFTNSDIISTTNEDENGTIFKEYRKLTADEIEEQRVSNITAKATQIIEAKYTPLKQRKMMSISIGLLSVGEVLTQDLIDANEWITTIRTIENLAIADGVLLDSVVWGVG